MNHEAMNSVRIYTPACLLFALASSVSGCTEPVSNSGEPSLVFTQVPAIGETAPLTGVAENVLPAGYGVAAYVYIEGAGGWWAKPSTQDALTSLGEDGSWRTDITPAPADSGASRVAAFLVPRSQALPVVEGIPSFPGMLTEGAVAQATVDRARKIDFGGHQWRVKPSSARVGPGFNFFSDSEENVWVDAEGWLHLQITRQGSDFYCAEVISVENLGYGTYTFEFESDVSAIDIRAVAGCFTWTDEPESNHREIDIEFTRWGDPANANAQFVVQPASVSDNIERFELPAGAGTTAHGFTWLPGRVSFFSETTGAGERVPIHNWTSTSLDTPEPAGENVRLNFYLIDGMTPPASGEDMEVVVSGFRFEAAADE